MKKLFIFILFFLCTNVSAINCKYNINGTIYSFDVGITTKSSYRSYVVNGVSLNEKDYSMNEIIVSDTFDDFVDITVPNDDTICPVLIKISGNEYKMLPYDGYVKYFAPENTIYCSNCGENEILVKYDGYDRFNEKVTFKGFCDMIGVGDYDTHYAFGMPVCMKYPLMFYFHFYLDSRYIDICRNYINHGDSTPFKDYFKDYDKNFALGENGNDDLNVCPLVSDSNDLSGIFKCITEKTIFVEERIQNFINSCTENEMRNIQAFASGSTAPFYIKGNVSEYLNNVASRLFHLYHHNRFLVNQMNSPLQN